MAFWTEVPDEWPAENIPERKLPPRCHLCGRFSTTLYPVWSKGWPTPDILFEVGNCCKEDDGPLV